MDILGLLKSGKKVSIGMVHTLPLPGAYLHAQSMDEIVRRAVADAKTLEAAGFDAVIVENVNDDPFLKSGLSNTQLAALAVVCAKVREAVSVPVGIDACGDAIAGIDIASVTGITFARVPYYVDIRISQNGLVLPNGGEAVMHRKQIGAEHVKIFADVQVKHTYALNDGIPIEVSAKWAASAKADALIVTGASTGQETPIEMIKRAGAAVSIPVVAGSGVTSSNVALQYASCSGAIIGSALKENGNLMNPVVKELAEKFIESVRASGL